MKVATESMQEEGYDRRRAANRQAQAAYRHRQRSRIEELEVQVQALKDELGLSDEDLAASVPSSGAQSTTADVAVDRPLSDIASMTQTSGSTAVPGESSRRASEHSSTSAGPAGAAERLVEHPGLRFLEGVTEVASVLGIPKGALLSPTEQSPFYLQAVTLPGQASFGPSIAPTAAQFNYQHHPLIDCIPIPEFRTRLILALAISPPLLKRAEIFYDLFTGGLAFTGNAYDQASWAFSQEFRAKWAKLLSIPIAELEARAQQL